MKVLPSAWKLSAVEDENMKDQPALQRKQTTHWLISQGIQGLNIKYHRYFYEQMSCVKIYILEEVECVLTRPFVFVYQLLLVYQRDGHALVLL